MCEEEKKQTVNEALGFPPADVFEKKVTDFLSREMSAESLTVALVDLDHFLDVNESFGREAGDRILIETGRYLAGKLPEGASIYRIGGDEFGIIFQGSMEKEDVFLLMERVRAEYPVQRPDHEAMTITAGIATAFDDASRYQELVRKAESAMYRGKYSGSNKVVLSREEKMVPKTSHYTADQLKRLTKLSKREGVGEAILLREALDMLLAKYDC